MGQGAACGNSNCCLDGEVEHPDRSPEPPLSWPYTGSFGVYTWVCLRCSIYPESRHLWICQYIQEENRYNNAKTLSKAASTIQVMRIIKLWPQTDWELDWKNLFVTPVLSSDLMTCYRVIHDIIPTNVRHKHIRMSRTDARTEWGQRDTLEHRLIECGEGTRTWNWTQSRLARMLRTSAAHIPSEWLTRPHFQLWPPQRHRAVLWMLARHVNFRLHNPPTLLPQELMDFMRRSKWNMYMLPNRRKLVANFLTILDISQ